MLSTENKEKLFELFKQNSELRQNIIENIESQVSTVKSICVSVCSLLLGFSIYEGSMPILIISAIMVVFFFVVEGIIKQNERGYIFMANQVQRELSYSEITDELFEFVIAKYAIDLNGWYSVLNGQDETLKKKYKRETSVFHVLRMKNVYVFYLCLFLVPCGRFVFLLMKG